HDRCMISTFQRAATRYDCNSLMGGKTRASDASEDDWKRDKVDDAKKRAITTSTCYDDFKSRVAGCTLKPIHRNEFNAPPKFAFNRQVQDDGPAALVASLSGAAASSQVRPQGAGAGVAARLATTATEQGGVEKLKNARELEREHR
ncbi:unnamed protein product, partial [Prorocentrum cordatum]